MPANRKVFSITSVSFDITADHDGHEIVVFAHEPAVINLPSACGFSAAITVKTLVPGGKVFVSTQRQETLDGTETYALDRQYAFVRLLSDGAQWLIVSAS